MSVYAADSSVATSVSLPTDDSYGGTGTTNVYPSTTTWPADPVGIFPDTRRYLPSDVPADWYDSSAYDGLSVWERTRLGIYTDIFDVSPPPDPWARRDPPNADNVGSESEKNLNVVLSNNARILRLFGHPHFINDEDPDAYPMRPYWSFRTLEGAGEAVEGYSCYVEYVNEIRIFTAAWTAGTNPQYITLRPLNEKEFVLDSSSLDGTDILG